jgi:uncharacterized protein (TIGR02599 family)
MTPRARLNLGFTLVELLVSTAIITLLMVVLVSITGQTSETWRYTSGKIEQFRSARAAFDTMTSRLSHATLNTYWDYDNPNTPTRYERRSELRFISGPVSGLLNEKDGDATRLSHAVFFHTQSGLVEDRPKFQGLENLLNTWGYYVEYASDAATRPEFLDNDMSPPRWRHRLMEFTLPAEKLSTYSHTSGEKDGKPKSISYKDRSWFTTPMGAANPPVHVISENIIALVITPRLAKREEQELQNSRNADPDFSPLAPKYSYDTSPIGTGLFGGGQGGTSSDARLNPINQLPPVVQVTMVAIDEPFCYSARAREWLRRYLRS